MLFRVLGPGVVIFRESAAAPEIAGRYKPLAHCIRSGGLAAWSVCHFELRNSVCTFERL